MWLGRFVVGMFCGWDVLWLGRFVVGTFCGGTFCGWDILWLGHFEVYNLFVVDEGFKS